MATYKLKRKSYSEFNTVRGLLGLGLTVGGVTANQHFMNNLMTGGKTDPNTADGKAKIKLFKILAKEFKEKYGKNDVMLTDNDFANFCFILKKQDITPELMNELRTIIGEENFQKLDITGPVIVIKADMLNPAILAHEMGHIHYRCDEGTSKSVQVAVLLNEMLNRYLIGGKTGAAILTGLTSGLLGGSIKEGTALSRINNSFGNGAVTGLLEVPQLVDEGSASLHGLRELKRHGASKEEMDEYKRLLKNAYGTYASGAVFNVGTNLVSREIGSILRK